MENMMHTFPMIETNIFRFTSTTDAANTLLIDFETAVFNEITNGNWTGANAIINSAAYDAQKIILLDGVQIVLDKVAQQLVDAEAAQTSFLNALMAVSGVLVAAMLAGAGYLHTKST